MALPPIKFRRQTSDDMERWRSRGGREEEDHRRERVRKKKMQAGARKRKKATKHYVFPMICGSGGPLRAEK